MSEQFLTGMYFVLTLLSIPSILFAISGQGFTEVKQAVGAILSIARIKYSTSNNLPHHRMYVVGLVQNCSTKRTQQWNNPFRYFSPQNIQLVPPRTLYRVLTSTYSHFPSVFALSLSLIPTVTVLILVLTPSARMSVRRM